MGMFFNAFFRHADVVRMANLAQMVNVIAPIMTNEKGLFLQTIYFPIVEYGRQRGNTSLDVWVSSPTYKMENRPQPAPYLDVSSTYDPGTHTVSVNVLNRSKDKDISTRIDNMEGKLENKVSIWEMNNSDLKATHTFADDKKLRPVSRNLSTGSESIVSGLNYTFPAHSLTVMRLQLK